MLSFIVTRSGGILANSGKDSCGSGATESAVLGPSCSGIWIPSHENAGDAGFALGASTALMGEKAAMACTVAVEKVIGEHYQEQLELLGDDHKDLKKTISKFRDDELEHHDIGIEHDAESAPGYKIMSKVIELGCKTAIAISKKI